MEITGTTPEAKDRINVLVREVLFVNNSVSESFVTRFVEDIYQKAMKDAMFLLSLENNYQGIKLIELKTGFLRP